MKKKRKPLEEAESVNRCATVGRKEVLNESDS